MPLRSNASTVRNFQVRLAADIHDLLKAIANRRRKSVADAIRDAVEFYVAGAAFADQGRRLMWIDSVTGEKAELLIPGLTTPPGYVSDNKESNVQSGE